MAEIIVKGLDELQRRLDTLPATMERKIMRGALSAGARVIRNKARTYIRDRSGKLARSLRVSSVARGGKVTARVVAGGRTRLGEVLYAMWVEYGTQPHYISVRESDKPVNPRLSARSGNIVRASMRTINRGALRFGNTFADAVHHPGSRPRPFMRPALDSSHGEAIKAVAEYVKTRLTDAGINSSSVAIELEGE